MQSPDMEVCTQISSPCPYTHTLSAWILLISAQTLSVQIVYQYSKQRRQFGRPAHFSNSRVEGVLDARPDEEHALLWRPVPRVTTGTQVVPPMCHQEVRGAEGARGGTNRETNAFDPHSLESPSRRPTPWTCR